tara:strand:+ start:854 stop:1141 length:288 start_codon:yes stop_codon:yes gene_type:complete
MLLTSGLAKYYIVALISVTDPDVPSYGWVQMLQGFDTRIECKNELAENEYMYFISIMQTLRNVIKQVEVMQCMTEENVHLLNRELGHGGPKSIGV